MSLVYKSEESQNQIPEVRVNAFLKKFELAFDKGILCQLIKVFNILDQGSLKYVSQ
jgi:hypothetical protein